MKQIDYLKLVATGRNSSYYARASDADEALKGLIAYGAIATWLVTFGAAVLASYLGANLEFTTVAKPIGSIAMFSVFLLICGFFVAGSPIFTRVAIAVLGALASIAIIAFGFFGRLEARYLFLPLIFFSTLVSFAAVRQLL